MANKQLNATITIGGAVAASLKGAIGSTNGKLQSIGQTIDKLKAKQRELNRVIKEQEKLGKGPSFARLELGEINKQIAALRTKSDLLRKELELKKRIKDARENFAGQARDRATAALAVGATVAYPAFSMLKDAAEFNYQLQLIGNTANMTKAEIADLSRQIMESSAATGQSATTLQSAIGFLVAAGMDTKTAVASINTIGRTATAAGADIEDLSRAAFVLNDSLKIAPKDLQAALDTLAQAGKEGNVELKNMAKVLPVLGSGMLSLKMEGREAAATMGAALEVARKGAADADEAANNMKNYIAKVMSPETLKKGKKNFGIDLYQIIKDAQKKGKNPFEESMSAIIKATKGDQKAIGDLFQDMQVQNFIRPLIQNWDEYKRIKEKSLKATGVTDQDFEKIMGTSKSQMDRLTGSFGRLKIALGETLEPAFAKIGTVLEPVLGKIEAFIKNNKALVGSVMVAIGGLAVLGTAILTVGAALAGIGWASTFAASGWLALSKVGSILGSVVFPLVARGFAMIGAAAMANPIGATIAAIAVGALLIYKYWEPISSFMVNLWNGISSTVSSALEIIRSTISTAFTSVGATVSSAVETIRSTVSGGFANVGAAFRAAWEPIRGWFSSFWTDISSATTNSVAAIRSALASGFLAVGSIFRAAWEPIRGYFSGLWNDLMGIVSRAIEWITSKVASMGAAISGLKNSFSFGGDFSAPVQKESFSVGGGSRAPALHSPGGSRTPPPPPPTMSARNSVSQSATYHQTFQINQQPGQSADDLAKKIVAKMKARDDADRRGRMFDPVIAGNY